MSRSPPNRVLTKSNFWWLYTLKCWIYFLFQIAGTTIHSQFIKPYLEVLQHLGLWITLHFLKSWELWKKATYYTEFGTQLNLYVWKPPSIYIIFKNSAHLKGCFVVRHKSLVHIFRIIHDCMVCPNLHTHIEYRDEWGKY